MAEMAEQAKRHSTSTPIGSLQSVWYACLFIPGSFVLSACLIISFKYLEMAVRKNPLILILISSVGIILFVAHHTNITANSGNNQSHTKVSSTENKVDRPDLDCEDDNQMVSLKHEMDAYLSLSRDLEHIRAGIETKFEEMSGVLPERLCEIDFNHKIILMTDVQLKCPAPTFGEVFAKSIKSAAVDGARAALSDTEDKAKCLKSTVLDMDHWSVKRKEVKAVPDIVDGWKDEHTLADDIEDRLKLRGYARVGRADTALNLARQMKKDYNSEMDINKAILKITTLVKTVDERVAVERVMLNGLDEIVVGASLHGAD